MKILAFNRFYLPGYQAGGPIVSLANLVEALRGDCQFRVVTTDRDLGSSRPYANVQAGWTPVDSGCALYLPSDGIATARLSALTWEVRAGGLYLNSFFDTWFTARILWARRLGRLPRARLILAPRGEFSDGALEIKGARKRAYIAALRSGGLLDEIDWHASTSFEAEEIEAAVGARAAHRIHIAPDLGAMPDDAASSSWRPRAAGEPLRICFLSRVSPKKNLVGAVRALGAMRHPAILTVYGPKEDRACWDECLRAAAELPAHVRMVDGGTLTRDEVHAGIARHDAFFLPTHGENYGHVIPEALSVGLPAVISDRTPWRGFAQKGIGYDGALDDAAFAAELDRIAELDAAALLAMRERARDFARSVLTDPAAVEANRRLFAG